MYPSGTWIRSVQSCMENWSLCCSVRRFNLFHHFTIWHLYHHRCGQNEIEDNVGLPQVFNWNLNFVPFPRPGVLRRIGCPRYFTILQLDIGAVTDVARTRLERISSSAPGFNIRETSNSRVMATNG